MGKNDSWGLVQVDQELWWLSRLSPRDVYELTRELKHSRNPALQLTKLINERAVARRDELRNEIARDARLISNPKLWEVPHLNLKSRPWVSELSGKQFARIFPEMPLMVAHKSNGEADTTFASADELLKIWTLD